MASVVERSQDKWRALVRRRGYPTQHRTFATKGEAALWAETVEAQMKNGTFTGDPDPRRTTLGDAIATFIDEGISDHAGADVEVARLRAFLNEETALCSYFLHALTPDHFSSYRDRRLKDVAPNTVRREMALLQSVIQAARAGTDLPYNPVRAVQRPKDDDVRIPLVRVPAEMEAALLAADPPDWLSCAITVALESAVRAAEFAALEAGAVDQSAQIAVAGKREIPLSVRSTARLADLAGTFPDPAAIRGAFLSLCDKAGVTDAPSFDALRDEAICRRIEQGWSLDEVLALAGLSGFASLDRFQPVIARMAARKLNAKDASAGEVATDRPLSQHAFVAIEDMELSVRGTRLLRELSCRFVGDILLFSAWEMGRIPNIGTKTIGEIAEVLSECGLPAGHLQKARSLWAAKAAADEWKAAQSAWTGATGRRGEDWTTVGPDSVAGATKRANRTEQVAGPRLPDDGSALFVIPATYKRMLGEGKWPGSMGGLLRYNTVAKTWWISKDHPEFSRMTASFANAEARKVWAAENARCEAVIEASIRKAAQNRHFRSGPMYRQTIEDLQTVASERGGACLSETYVNARKKLRWRCAKGHEWEAEAASIKRGRWCPDCAHALRRRTIDDARSLARERGGECLSATYVNSATKLRWRCAKGHEWAAPYGSIKQGSWCPSCAGLAPLSIDDARSLARERGGECLSATYVNSATKLRWRCAKGHEWEALIHPVKRGTWCARCVGLARLSIDDARSLARERGGECLSATYVNSATKLRWRCAEGHEWEAACGSVRHGTWCPLCAIAARAAKKGNVFRPRLTIEDMHAVARERGGECLSETYVNNRTKLRWRCAEGHEWETQPLGIRKGQWCPLCARVAKPTIDSIRSLARERGGECLSDTYVNGSAKLRWRCAEGHEWISPYVVVRAGAWCRECARVKRVHKNSAPRAEGEGA